MIIGKLILSGFRCHERLDIPMPPVLLVTGPNGSGKSSIQAALEWAFSGRCAFTDEKGSNGQLGRDGGKGYVSLVSCDENEGDTGQATRSTDGHLTLSWKPSAKSGEAQAALEHEMGCTGDQARLALRAGRFFGMNAKEQKSLLYEMLNLTITSGQVKLALTELGAPRSLPLVATAVKLLGGHEDALVDIGRAYKVCYEERTVQNRLAKTAKAKVQELKKEGESLIFPTDEARAKVIRDIAENQSALDAAAKAEGARETLIIQRSHLTKSRDVAAEALRIAGQGLGDAPPDTSALWERKPAVQSRLDGIKKLIADATGQRSAALRARESLEHALRLESSRRGQGSGCQYDQSHPCPGAATRQANVESEIAQLPTIETFDKQLAELKERSIKGQAILDGIDDQLKMAVRWEKLSSAKDNLAKAEAALESCPIMPAPDDFIKGLKNAGVTLGDLIDSVPGLLDSLKRKREQLQSELESHRAWSAHQKRVNEAKVALEEAEYSATILNELVPFFAPDGYQARVLREQLKPLLDRLSQILDRWNLAARYTDELYLQVRTRECWVDYARLSDGEQVLVALAHQVAFAYLTGLQIVVIDRIEALDESRQSILLNACAEIVSVEGGPDHIVLLGVRCVAPPVGVTHIDLAPALVGAA